MSNPANAAKILSDTLESLQASLEELSAADEELIQRNDELMRAQSELQESEERYRRLFNGMTEGFALHEVICDENGTPADFRFLDINPAFERLTGLKRKDVIGRSHNEILPDDDPRWVREYGAVALTGKPTQFENYSPALKRHYEVFAYSPAPRQFAVIFMDITERKKMVEALRKSEGQFKALIENLSSGVALVDESSKFTIYNPAFLKMFGLSEDTDIKNVNDQNWSDWQVYEEDGTLLHVDNHPVRKAAMTGKPIRNKLVGVRLPKGGDLIWMQISAEPVLKPDGKIELLICTYQDVTERKKAEEAFRKSEAKLRAVFRSLSEGIVFLNTKGDVEEVNDAVQRIHGHTLEELADPKLDPRWQIIRPDGTLFPVDEQPAIVALRTGQAVQDVEMGVPTSDGKLRWRLVNAQPVYDDSENLLGAVASFFDITERKLAEEALREGQALLRAITDDTTDLVFVKDLRSRIIFANPALIQMIGKPRESIMGKCDREFYDDPEIGETIMANDRRIMESGQTEVIEEVAQTPDGYRTYLSTKTPYRNDSGEIIGIIGIARDITERKKAEEAVASARRQVQSIIDNTPAVIYAFDLEERFLLANTATAELLNSTPEQMIGKRRHEFMPKDDADWHEANDRQVMEAGRALEFEEYSQLKGRSITWLTTKFPLRDARGRIYAIAGISADISERKKAEEERQSLLQELEVHSRDLQEANEQLAAVNEELAASNEELRSTTEELQKARNELELRIRERTFELSEAKENLEEINQQLHAEILEHEETEKDLLKAKAAAEAAIEAKAAFLANMSHELRTPLNAVIGFSSLLLEDNLTQDQKEYIERIRVGGEALLALISDILEFSKAEKEKITLEHQPLSIKHCIEESMSMVAMQANDKGLNLAYTINYGTPDTIIGDPGRLRQVLANLLSNAVKFTDNGEISISVSSKALEGNKRQITFAVKDTGIGMPQEKMDRLFQPFTQLEYVISRKRDGAGLGLSICKKLVELMGGEIWAESEEGKGSTFRFTIQAETIPGKQLDVGEKDKAAAYENLSAQKPLSILVAEDNPSNQRVLVAMLKRLGYRPDAVADGCEVLQALQIRPYDLIFMDIKMPEMDGLTATKEIRKRWPDNGPKIVAITAFAMDGDQEKCLEAGMDGYIAKPVKIDNLATLLRNIIHNK